MLYSEFLVFYPLLGIISVLLRLLSITNFASLRFESISGKGDGNESTREKEGRKARQKMVLQGENCYQREGTVGGGSV